MKKLMFILSAILLVTPAFADGGHGYGHRGDHGGGWSWGGWLFPALVGGAIIYDLAQPQTVVQPQTVYVQPAPVYPPPVVVSTSPYWYFCAGANAYYPYVATCPGGWQTVPATPPVAASVPPNVQAR